MPTCPCCSDNLLRHVRDSRVYWFCLTCHQEMPPFEALMQAHQRDIPLTHRSKYHSG
ncbi:MAG: hypothetical protein EDM05_57005 [Leptolyngbya sp. IPPAS B-1204]|uniref:Uncharacterized protein n=1 Tax=Leptolyngbya sp. NK1-12 TaxID=2547451 RepID=A0AA97AJ70_9CYAN|nr:hypothetical protein [Leptolyngbya sp. NK1-12]MBF2050449.1 hypothetical protein [Elainella sp. C42_A2020_010]WNZ26324.1 hypothetical protein HJG54_28235 [Leptolyngbya sp. NK1-12]